MKRMRNNRDRRGFRSCLWMLGFVLAAQACVHAQEAAPTNAVPGLPATNAVPAATNPIPEAGAVMMTNMPAVTNAVIETNTTAMTNLAGTTNSLALTNESAGTNLPSDTHEMEHSATGPATNAPGQFTPGDRLDYGSFRIIYDRNIFNPNRSGRAPTRTYERRDYRRPPRVESFSLVGTMSYEKGQIAFFDSGSYQYRKAVKLADTIAGYRLVEVLQNKVRLAAGTNVVELPVGTQMRREDDGPWNLGGAAEPVASSAPVVAAAPPPPILTTNAETGVITTNVPAAAAAASTPTESASAPPPAASSDASEILRKLMQRREQEMNK